MRFVKMHGIGNDYICIDCFAQTVANPANLARRISDRHFGVGADGLILILPSDIADAKMRIFNADGSEAEMCGNGIRCVAKYVHDHGISSNNPLRIETSAGIKTISLTLNEQNKVILATVDMGEPILEPSEIPVKIAQERAIDIPLETPKGIFKMTCVSMGNPHAVIFVDNVDKIPLHEIGPMIENHSLFPSRVNVHFVKVLSRKEVIMRTWERGSGETLACGTGASA
ncbi:MAG: diaminopimelate epimerase, partial [Planctomycetes bacterium]|nr:diaminopimelate epimerase [Planctomycetota bacterium]